MTPLVPIHGRRARRLFRLSGRQRSARPDDVTRARKKRPGDTVKGVWGLSRVGGVGAEPPQDTVARKPAEEQS